MRRVIPKGLVFTVDLSKLADRELPEGSEMTVDEYRRTIEAPNHLQAQEPFTIDWGDGTTETFPVSTGYFVTHTYAESAGDKFTVVMRSPTGKLPIIEFNTGQLYNVEPEANVSLALVSIDHFGGMVGNQSPTANNYLARNCYNLTYIDTRLPGLPKWTSHDYTIGVGIPQKVGALVQSIESFCFDFMTNATMLSFYFQNQRNLEGTVRERIFNNNTLLVSIRSMFYNCQQIKGLPSGLLSNQKGINDIRYAFNGCVGLTEPCIFWDENGDIDTANFPALTADKAANTYTGCSAALRAQVPTAYGGTMTVS